MVIITYTFARTHTAQKMAERIESNLTNFNPLKKKLKAAVREVGFVLEDGNPGTLSDRQALIWLYIYLTLKGINTFKKQFINDVVKFSVRRCLYNIL